MKDDYEMLYSFYNGDENAKKYEIVREFRMGKGFYKDFPVRNDIYIARINANENLEIQNLFGIHEFPTIMHFKAGI